LPAVSLPNPSMGKPHNRRRINPSSVLFFGDRLALHRLIIIDASG
jgi:hypothetical protein